MNAAGVLSEVLNRPITDLAPGTRLDAIPEFDSMTLVNLVVRLEALIGRMLSEDEMEGLATVQNVEDLLRG